jgi:phage gpG-like protein
VENIGDDMSKQFAAFEQKAHGVLKKFPLLMANRGKNFFQDRFRDQAWYDEKYEPWPKRKEADKKGRGRAILTLRGHLKRGNRIKQADWGAVIVGNDVPYAEPHNNGSKETVQVHAHGRVASRKVGTKAMKLKGKQKVVRIGGRKVKIQGASHTVKAHSRKMNLPRRRFIGNSALLNRLINRDFINELKTL